MGHLEGVDLQLGDTSFSQQAIEALDQGTTTSVAGEDDRAVPVLGQEADAAGVGCAGILAELAVGPTFDVGSGAAETVLLIAGRVFQQLGTGKRAAGDEAGVLDRPL